MTSQKTKSFSVRIYLQDGHAEGVKIISKSKWPGRGLVLPRASFAQEKDRKELDAAGIYVLVGHSNEANQPIICIGAANPVGTKIQQHDTHDTTWSSAIIFTCKENSLSLAQCKYMAAYLLQHTQVSCNICLEDELDSLHVELTADEKNSAMTFLKHALSLFPIFGVTVFNQDLN